MYDIAHSARLHNLERTFVRDGLEVDVHWSLGTNPPPSLRAASLLGRCERAVISGSWLPIAAPVDAMLISAHHAMRGYFAPHEAVKDMCDLSAWWTQARNRWFLRSVARGAAEADLSTSLHAMWTVVARRDTRHPAVTGVTVLERWMSRSQLREASGLAAFIEEQLTHGRRAERTVQVFGFSVLPRDLAGALARTRRELPAQLKPQPSAERKSLQRRLERRVERALRVARELACVRSLASYRALARAQSRFL